MNPLRSISTQDEELRSLLAISAQGDPAALEKLLAAVSPRVIASCQRTLGRYSADVEDAAQESLLGFARALSGYRGECAVLSFATAIAVRTCLGIRRRHGRRETLWKNANAADASVSEEPQNPAIVAQQRELLRDLIASLSPILAEALTLRILIGLPLSEVAEVSGVPVNTIRSRVRLAKEGLRLMIESNPVAADFFGDDT